MVHKKLISFLNQQKQPFCPHRIEEQHRWCTDPQVIMTRGKHGVNPPWMSMMKYKSRQEFGVVVVTFISLKFRLDFF